MALSCEMNNTSHLLLLHEGIDGVEVADISFDKAVVRFILNILEVSQITCICEFVHIDDAVIRVLVYEKSYYVATNKTCATSNDNRFHNIMIFN